MSDSANLVRVTRNLINIAFFYPPTVRQIWESNTGMNSTYYILGKAKIVPSLIEKLISFPYRDFPGHLVCYTTDYMCMCYGEMNCTAVFSIKFGEWGEQYDKILYVACDPAHHHEKKQQFHSDYSVWYTF